MLVKIGKEVHRFRFDKRGSPARVDEETAVWSDLVAAEGDGIVTVDSLVLWLPVLSLVLLLAL